MSARPLLRAAREAEAAALSALALRSKAYWGYDAAFVEACRAELTLAGPDLAARRTVVAEEPESGRVLGLRTLEGSPPRGVLGMFFVDPVAIGRGVGRFLYEDMLAQAARLGFTRLSIDADPHAEGFYRAMGAVTVGRVPSGSIAGRTLPLMTVAVPR